MNKLILIHNIHDNNHNFIDKYILVNNCLIILKPDIELNISQTASSILHQVRMYYTIFHGCHAQFLYALILSHCISLCL